MMAIRLSSWAADLLAECPQDWGKDVAEREDRKLWHPPLFLLSHACPVHLSSHPCHQQQCTCISFLDHTINTNKCTPYVSVSKTKHFVTVIPEVDQNRMQKQLPMSSHQTECTQHGQLIQDTRAQLGTATTIISVPSNVQAAMWRW